MLKRHERRPWLQIKLLETAKLPLVERQSTTEKHLTHLLYEIAQDVKAPDLSQSMPLSNFHFPNISLDIIWEMSSLWLMQF